MTEINLRNYRWPAEWEPHDATWVTWPVNAATWPGLFERIPPAFAAFVATIARFEPVHVLVQDVHAADAARRLLDAACERSGAAFRVSLWNIPVNDSWCRDYGPIFLNRRPEVTDGPPQVIIDWDYNAWGGKYPPWDQDAAVAGTIAAQLSVPLVKPGIILEGGAIEGNGAGTLLTTRSCLQNPNRNPQLSPAMTEQMLRDYLQVESIVWLDGGGIVGDDTDGHIDQVARFVDEQRVVVASPWTSDAPEAEELRANFDAVARATNASGESLLPIELRMPSPKFQQEHRLPACFCNFYIANGGIIVPTFGDPADDEALHVLQSEFPAHEVVGVSAIDLVWGLGAFHCMTQQQPAI